MKNLQFLKILKEILRFLKKNLKFYRNFRENLQKNLESFGNIYLELVLGAPPTEPSEIIRNLAVKSMDT